MPKVVLKDVTFSHVHVFNARPNKQGVMKFSSCILVDKSNAVTITAMKAAQEKAIQEGITLGKFTAAMIPALKLPIRDGDAELATEIKSGAEYKDRLFVNANTPEKSPPGVLKPEGGIAVPILDPLEFFSGCRGHASVSFYPYKVPDGAKGVAVGLNGCYKLAEGERLDGRENQADVFSEFASEDSSESLSTESEAAQAKAGAKQDNDPFN